MSNTVIFGGAFDPPHLGHSMVISIILSKIECNHLLVLPCYKSAFGKEMSGFDDRVEMCKRAFGPLFGGRVFVSAAERMYKARNSLEFISKFIEDRFIDLNEEKIIFVIGEDNWKNRHKWHNLEEIEKLVSFFVVGRGAGREMAVSVPDISSTYVRECVTKGNKAETNFEELVHNDVAEYIRENGLYDYWEAPCHIELNKSRAARAGRNF